MDAVAEFAEKLKEARKAKGISQRALAKLAGVPQSHISKIETTGVDLRISSLVEIARALDLELTLVPRKTIPAVNSIVRSTQTSAPRQIASITKELSKLESVTDKIARQHQSLKEVSQLQSRIHDLTRFELPPSYLNTIEKLNKQLQQVYKEPETVQKLNETVRKVQELRNQLAHGSVERVKASHRAVYSLEEDDHG
jgi:transcriptional regulator with XRE-family HTH domain